MRAGLPRPRLIPFAFELPSETQPPVTFHFNAWVFDFMREQWARVGAQDHAAQVESMNTATGAELMATAKRALSVGAYVAPPTMKVSYSQLGAETGERLA